MNTQSKQPLTKNSLRVLFAVDWLKGYLVGSVQLEADDGSLSPHAMVLDTMRDGEFIFKNTYSVEKKFEIEVDHENAPDEFFFCAYST